MTIIESRGEDYLRVSFTIVDESSEKEYRGFVRWLNKNCEKIFHEKAPFDLNITDKTDVVDTYKSFVIYKCPGNKYVGLNIMSNPNVKKVIGHIGSLNEIFNFIDIMVVGSRERIIREGTFYDESVKSKLVKKYDNIRRKLYDLMIRIQDNT